MNKFSEKISAARKAKGLSQEAAAELLSVSRQAVAKWECGKSYPSTENLLAISKLYNIPLEQLCPTSTDEKENEINIRPIANIFCCISAILAVAALVGGAGIGSVICCFIIAVPMQLFVHLYFSSCVKNGDFSGIAGFDESTEYNLAAVKDYLTNLDFMLCSHCTAYTGIIALCGLFAPQIDLAALMILFCGSYVYSALLYGIFFSRKIYVREEDYLRAKRGYPSICIFVALVLLSIAEIVFVFERFGIENNTPQALAAVGIALPAWAAAVIGTLAEQRRISKGGAARFGKAFIICSAAALLLFAALPFAVKFI